ncbi:MAG: NAD(P)H-quinone oxidoreductase subunit 4, partial [Moorea sp. SIO4A3]|nr:NAD(P)H-quinone oxidoreductase subunit 4 [Moorena sp. SIO4A3]NEO46445.1 NAD(P)H-quinone oxidoreductase subunit 4 [Moorena sp. SIO4A3]
LYPKLVTQTYDVKTVAVAAQMRQSLPVIVQEESPLYSGTFTAPQLANTKAQPILGVTQY